MSKKVLRSILPKRKNKNKLSNKNNQLLIIAKSLTTILTHPFPSWANPFTKSFNNKVWEFVQTGRFQQEQNWNHLIVR